LIGLDTMMFWTFKSGTSPTALVRDYRITNLQPET
jgi:hypothetical protein